MADLCYRKARDRADRLGQVWTPRAIADLLARSIALVTDVPMHVLDLGAGSGVLTVALDDLQQCDSATLIEIDPDQVNKLQELKLKRKRVIGSDVFSTRWQASEHPNVILSNPPYGTVEASEGALSLLGESALNVPVNGRWVRSDAAFLARAWELSKISTNIGFIVAEPIVANASYRPMRCALVKGMRSLCVTKLPPLTFDSTEVSAYLITGQRAVKRSRNVMLRKASADGSVFEELEVKGAAGALSLDIDYHQALRRLGVNAENMETLGSLEVRVNRGSRSKKAFREAGIDAFHTTDFPKGRGKVALSGQMVNRCQTAGPGDILISRVGSRCLSRQAKVAKGTGVFTDCVYRISADRAARGRIWRTLNSAFGEEWRQANAVGSCAKHLPLGTLLGLPLLD